MTAPKPPGGPPPAIPVGLQRLLRAARRDDGNLNALLTERSEYAALHGIHLTLTERAILESVPEPQLRQIIASLPDHDVVWDEPDTPVSGGVRPAMPSPLRDPIPDAEPDVVITGIRPDMPPPKAPSFLERLRRLLRGQ